MASVKAPFDNKAHIKEFGLGGVDGGIGRVLDDFASCCGEFNYAKLDYYREEFVARCIRAARRHGGI